VLLPSTVHPGMRGEGWGKAHALYPSPQAKFTGIVRPGGWGCPAPPLLMILVGPSGHLGRGESNTAARSPDRA